MLLPLLRAVFKELLIKSPLGEQTCRAVVCHTTGGPEVMAVEEIRLESPQPGDVLIQVAACGVNRPDLLQRQGVYPPPPQARSQRLGLEVAGTVVTDASPWALGAQVCALVDGGGYAERVWVDARHCFPVPKGLTLQEAASLPEVYLTVWANLVMDARLSAGQRVLVTGGSSGIGAAAIQLARALGADVWATVGHASKQALPRQLGVRDVFLYTDPDWPDQLKASTNGEGVDVVLDMAAGESLASSVRVLRKGGRLAIIGLQAGRFAQLDCAAVLTKHLQITGSTLRSRSPDEKAYLVQQVRERVWPFFEQGQIRPVVDKIYPFSQVVEAHQRLESGQVQGKLVLNVGLD